MFSWICPRCGRENRASDTECANCKLKEEPAEVAAETTVKPREPEPEIRYRPPAETRPATMPEAPAASPGNPLAAPLQHREPPRAMNTNFAARPKSGLPTWLLVPLFTLAFLGLGALLYFGFQRFGGGKAGFTGGESAVAKPKATNPLQRYVEVVGLRLTQDARKKLQARFIAVNHGAAELTDLTANVTLWASTSRSEEDSVGTFTFKINSLGPNEAKEITTPLKTKLKMYELPDWQNLTAEVQLTSQ